MGKSVLTIFTFCFIYLLTDISLNPDIERLDCNLSLEFIAFKGYFCYK